jgi:hypothetical protein
MCSSVVQFEDKYQKFFSMIKYIFWDKIFEFDIIESYINTDVCKIIAFNFYMSFHFKNL